MGNGPSFVAQGEKPWRGALAAVIGSRQGRDTFHQGFALDLGPEMRH